MLVLIGVAAVGVFLFVKYQKDKSNAFVGCDDGDIITTDGRKNCITEDQSPVCVEETSKMSLCRPDADAACEFTKKYKAYIKCRNCLLKLTSKGDCQDDIDTKTVEYREYRRVFFKTLKKYLKSENFRIVCKKFKQIDSRLILLAEKVKLYYRSQKCADDYEFIYNETKEIQTGLDNQYTALNRDFRIMFKNDKVVLYQTEDVGRLYNIIALTSYLPKTSDELHHKVNDVDYQPPKYGSEKNKVLIKLENIETKYTEKVAERLMDLLVCGQVLSQ